MHIPVTAVGTGHFTPWWSSGRRRLTLLRESRPRGKGPDAPNPCPLGAECFSRGTKSRKLPAWSGRGDSSPRGGAGVLSGPSSAAGRGEEGKAQGP